MLFIWRVAQSHSNQDEEDKERPNNLNQQLELCTAYKHVERAERETSEGHMWTLSHIPLFKDERLSLANCAFRKAGD